MKSNRSVGIRVAAALVALLLSGAAALLAQEPPQPPQPPQPPLAPQMGQPGMGPPPWAGGGGFGRGLGPGQAGPFREALRQRLQRGRGMQARPFAGRMRAMRRPGAPGMPGMPGNIPDMLRRPEIQKELGITEEQRRRMEEIGFNTKKAEIQQRAALEVLRLELDKMKRADAPDRAAIDKKIGEIGQAEAAMMRTMTNAELDFRGVITKEQRDRIPQVLNRLRNERRPTPPPAAAPGGPQPKQTAPRKQVPPQNPPPRA